MRPIVAIAIGCIVAGYYHVVHASDAPSFCDDRALRSILETPNEDRCYAASGISLRRAILVNAATPSVQSIQFCASSVCVALLNSVVTVMGTDCSLQMGFRGVTLKTVVSPLVASCANAPTQTPPSRVTPTPTATTPSATVTSTPETLIPTIEPNPSSPANDTESSPSGSVSETEDSTASSDSSSSALNTDPIPSQAPPPSIDTPVTPAPVDGVTSSSTSASTPTIPVGGIVGGGLALIILLVVCWIVYQRRRRKSTREDVYTKTAAGTDTSATNQTVSTTATTIDHRVPNPHIWNDPVILAARIPLDDVIVGPLLGQGAHGEVYIGLYGGVEVAVKQLPRDRRRELHHLEAFLSEIKIMATIRHPHIVRFVGVAWNALSELSLVTEFVPGGDLTTMLVRYEAEGRPRGFTRDKIKCALHIARALAYLHTRQSTPILHRDLKSRNILVTEDLDAKLTDFGVSRDYADETMTGGVGTSLWMAPEVLMGRRYSEKADIFSFGVVLSELDTQQPPYANAREEETGARLPETVVVQMVTMGLLGVEFSSGLHLADLADLGRACVSVEPCDRPSAVEIQDRIQQIMDKS